MITEKQEQAITMLGYLFNKGAKRVIVNNVSKAPIKGEDFTIEAMDHMHQEHGYVFLYESKTDELIISKEA